MILVGHDAYEKSVESRCRILSETEHLGFLRVPRLGYYRICIGVRLSDPIGFLNRESDRMLSGNQFLSDPIPLRRDPIGSNVGFIDLGH